MSSSHAPWPGELDIAIAFLSFARHCVLKKADGLSEEQLRRALVDSGTCILGLVQHLDEAERYWFGYHLAGAAWVMTHMTSQTARHAGRADILRNCSTAPPVAEPGVGALAVTAGSRDAPVIMKFVRNVRRCDHRGPGFARALSPLPAAARPRRRRRRIHDAGAH
jgi:Protein of unknown function (DUF664)